MTRMLLVAIACAGALSACGASRASTPQATAPAPNAPIPREPDRLADRLRETEAELGGAIDRWLQAPAGARTSAPGEVTLWALFEQRALRLLARKPALASATAVRLPAEVRRKVGSAVSAKRDLDRLTPRSHRRRYKTGRPLPAATLLAYYRHAQARFGVSWNVLAAVNFVESAFNKLRNDSASGAQGPMQFIPSTWRAYGLGGDIHDPRDAIIGAANYLRANGAPRSNRRALYHYNPSSLYVDAVLRYAAEIRRDRRAFYDYYSWQVFVRAAHGDRRLTGPGLR